MFVNESNMSDPYGMNSLMQKIEQHVQSLKQQLTKKNDTQGLDTINKFALIISQVKNASSDVDRINKINKLHTASGDIYNGKRFVIKQGESSGNFVMLPIKWPMMGNTKQSWQKNVVNPLNNLELQMCAKETQDNCKSLRNDPDEFHARTMWLGGRRKTRRNRKGGKSKTQVKKGKKSRKNGKSRKAGKARKSRKARK